MENLMLQRYALWAEVGEWAKKALPTVLIVLGVLVLGWWAASLLTSLLSRALKRSKVDGGVHSFVCSLCKTVLRGIVLISALATLGVNVTSIITALGAAGVTAGLALKDSLSNFASGVVIMFNKPFKVGDFLEIDSLTGTVKQIDLMYTTLRTADNKAILLPNSMVTANKIINYTAEPVRRLDLEFSVSYGADLAKARQVLANAVAQCPLALEKPAPVFGVSGHKDSSITILALVWCNAENFIALKFDLLERVKNAFDENGISIPFPQLDVHFLPEEEACAKFSSRP